MCSHPDATHVDAFVTGAREHIRMAIDWAVVELGVGGGGGGGGGVGQARYIHVAIKYTVATSKQVTGF